MSVWRRWEFFDETSAWGVVESGFWMWLLDGSRHYTFEEILQLKGNFLWVDSHIRVHKTAHRDEVRREQAETIYLGLVAICPPHLGGWRYTGWTFWKNCLTKWKHFQLQYIIKVFKHENLEQCWQHHFIWISTNAKIYHFWALRTFRKAPSEKWGAVRSV